jgi:CheY-like chemotaxis protein
MNFGTASESMAAAKGHSWQVLVVTDNIIDRKLASGLLAKHGHQVSVAVDGAQAAQACQNGHFDLVVVDLFLRELNATELVRVIRDREKVAAKACAILAVATDANELEGQLQEFGLDGFLAKPLSIDQVNQWMDDWTRKHQPAVPSSEGCSGCTSNTIDWTDALEAVGGRRELLNDLIEIFFEEYPPTLAEIREAIDQQNVKQLQLSAHKLKGCLRYFGRSAACEKAQELEYLARNGTLSGAAGRLVELETAMSTLLPLLKEKHSV